MKSCICSKVLIALGILAGLFGMATSAKAIDVNDRGEVILHSGNGSINWTTKKLEACGIADPDQSTYGQVKAAQIAARAELLSLLKKVRIKGSYGVIQGLLRKDICETELDGFLKNSYVTKPRTNDMGLIEAKAFLFLDRNGNTVLMPENVIFKTDAEPWQAPATKVASSVRYTGLIIDARGLDLEPAMAPRILVEGNLMEVYGASTENMDTALNQGFSGYSGTLQKAREMKERIGPNPLEIKASGGAYESDVVIAREDANDLAAALKSHDFLGECRVVIVLN